MTRMRSLFYFVISGITMTLFSGLVRHREPLLVGATYYGYPFPWLVQLVVAPQYFPWHVDPVWLVVDVLFWAIVTSLIHSISLILD